jgi:hypothetical protein
MLRANQNTLSDSQRASLQSFMGSWQTSLFDFSTPSAGAVTQPRLRLTATEFIESTYLEVTDSKIAGIAPFRLWDGQRRALATMEHDRLAVFLKARQLGISWVVCGFALWSGLTFPNQTVLAYSQGQLEANELTRRVSVLYHNHARRIELPQLIRDNTSLLEWDNGFRFMSLAATRKAGRSFTASIAILDEWAFMAWPRQTLAAVKPTIDAGGKLFIISSADGQGSAYHQFWQHAQSGINGYKAVFLPWFAHPDRGPDWRDQKIVEASGDTASVLREYPANDIEAFTAAAGLVYSVWSDGPPDGNVTETAEYLPDGGPIIWAGDDGYHGKLDQQTGQYTADSSPRVFLLIQERDDGTLVVFDEDYAVEMLSETHIERVLAKPYPDPDYAVIDSAAAELRGRLQTLGIGTYGKPQSIDESIKVTRRFLAPDANGRRRLIVHPRCTHLRYELASYRYDDKGNAIDMLNHGPDALRYLCWKLRLS